ncbi:hypothetical protein COLO4_00408 [Corchorus olitorius]|uniref:Uncharacterized protein n=1 Tax=Corchorus olitorius TaxID=93759 RepID=A0A1R3L3V6_9ROSI|nr:hypothetical protein COLO4_00408 [Corchorus olitorius]
MRIEAPLVKFTIGASLCLTTVVTGPFYGPEENVIEI